MRVDVLYNMDQAPGWAPVTSLAHLAARLFDGDLIPLSREKISTIKRLLNLRKRGSGRSGKGLLVILRTPSGLARLRNSAEFRNGYEFVAVWIIDSFWTEHIPMIERFTDIDFLGYMRPNDSARYERLCGNRACLLGWGSDVLEFGGASTERDIDVLRIGRQPAEWDDDRATQAVCAEFDLTFSGRPQTVPDPIAEHATIMAHYARSRYVIASSNLCGTAPYTHPTEEYVTARWTDAVSCGAIVAGLPPRSDQTIDRLFWPGALLEFDRIDLRHNVAAIAEAAAVWEPALAVRNYRNALARLDWRWRLKKIDDFFSIRSEELNRELDQIAARTQM